MPPGRDWNSEFELTKQIHAQLDGYSIVSNNDWWIPTNRIIVIYMWVTAPIINPHHIKPQNIVKIYWGLITKMNIYYFGML